MDLDDYQAKTRNTATYPHAFSGTQAAVNYTVVGLVGEAGEIANKWKKLLRGDVVVPGPITLQRSIEDEIGDVLWYAARLAEELGTSLGAIAARNLLKLETRMREGTIQGNGDDR